MREEGFFSRFGNIKTISIGIVYVLFNLWVIFHADQYFPEGMADEWLKVLMMYGFLNLLVLGNADLRNKLFNVKLTRFLPRFIFFFIIFMFFFYYILKWIDPLQGSTFFQMMQNVPLWLAIIHAFTFATTESIVWQGFLDLKIGIPWSSITAGVFHYGIWEGSFLVVVLSASLLFLFFSFVHHQLKKGKNDFAPVIGCHAAFNFVQLGFMLGSGGAV